MPTYKTTVSIELGVSRWQHYQYVLHVTAETEKEARKKAAELALDILHKHLQDSLELRFNKAETDILSIEQTEE